MTLNTKLLEAIQRLQIADVTLKSINATLAEDFVPGISEDNDALGFQVVAPVCRSVSRYDGEGADEHRRRAVFEMFAGLRLLRPNPNGHTSLSSEELDNLECAKVECYFYVMYDETSLTDQFLDDDALALFADHNVPFNMWPYWREVVQSACSRMGLPRVVLPPHRLKKSASQEAAQQQLELKVSTVR